MKITRVTVQNFLGIGTAEFALDDRGLVLVQGENRDDSSQNSNGSGKSSLIDTIFWCLHGKTSRGLSGDAVINRVVGSDCVVKVFCMDGSDEIEVTRWRKAKGFHKKHGVSVTVNGTDETKGTDALTQAAIDEILGASEDVFKAAVYSAQEDMVDIPSMTDRQLKSLIEEAANITEIETSYVVAREKVQEADRDMQAAHVELERAQERIDQATLEVSNAKRDVEAWTERQTLRRDEFLSQAKGKVAEAKAYADKMKAEAGKRENLDAKVEDFKGKIEALESEIGDLDAKLAEVSQYQNEADKTKESLDDAKLKVGIIHGKVQTAKKEVAKAERNVQRAKERVGEPCNECGKPLGEDDLEVVIKNANTALEKSKTNLATLEEKLENGEKVISKRIKVHGAARDAVPDTSKIVAKKRELQANIRMHQESVSLLRDALRKLAGMSEGLEDLKRTARNLKERADEVMRVKNPYIDQVAKREAKVTELTEAHVKALEAYEASSYTLLIAKEVANVFGPKGVRAHILDTVTPYLNDRTAHYIAALSDGNIEAVWTTLTEDSKGELKEKFSIVVTKYGEGTFQALSGGEKRKVRLSTMLALQDLVASRASKPIGLWVGDEIDEALDTAGLERLMGLLEMKARDRGTVLIVSHNDLKDWCRDTVTVTMEDKQATVEGVLCH